MGTICVAKTLLLISCSVTAQFVSAPLFLHNAKVWFSYDTAQIITIKSALMFVERLEINWVAQLPK